MNFWQKLKVEKNPIMVLAPMADVTDSAFRRIIAKYGKPDVIWTEFVSADGLFMGGREHLIRDLIFDPIEKPIVAQFFTSRPENMQKAAELAREMGFDGIDINMGCPDKSIEKQGAGAAMMKTPDLAREVIRAAKAGAGNLPVSVKTRIGFNKVELDTWLPEILKENPALVTIHARTRKELSLVPARWEFVKRAVEIRNAIPEGQPGHDTLIFGNGDATDIADAKKKALESGADGVMLGRAIFGNPWLFAPEKRPESIAARLRVMVEHTKLFEELLSEKNFAIMKKHYKAYVNGWDGAKEFRVQLMAAETAGEVEGLVEEYISVHNIS
jgi:nifR3 family TIM-barrel protein